MWGVQSQRMWLSFRYIPTRQPQSTHMQKERNMENRKFCNHRELGCEITETVTVFSIHFNFFFSMKTVCVECGCLEMAKTHKCLDMAKTHNVSIWSRLIRIKNVSIWRRLISRHVETSHVSYRDMWMRHSYRVSAISRPFLFVWVLAISRHFSYWDITCLMTLNPKP